MLTDPEGARLAHDVLGTGTFNVVDAATVGARHGAAGFLLTDWGDNGHWQPLPVSYLGFAYGAALGWDYGSNREIDIAATAGRYAFRDSQGIMGRLAYDLGNIYEESDIRVANGTILFYLLQIQPHEMEEQRKRLLAGELSDPSDFEGMRTRIDEVMAPLDQAEMDRADAELVRAEFTWVADMLRHACGRALWLLDGAPTPNETLATEAGELIDRYQILWLARNRPGGYLESVARMEAMRDDYL